MSLTHIQCFVTYCFSHTAARKQDQYRESWQTSLKSNFATFLAFIFLTFPSLYRWTLNIKCWKCIFAIFFTWFDGLQHLLPHKELQVGFMGAKKERIRKHSKIFDPWHIPETQSQFSIRNFNSTEMTDVI